MKRKVLLLIFIIFLILSLTNCGLNPPPGMSEWMKAEERVYLYWKAIINRQYELAKWDCVLDGVWYNKTDEWEEYINTNSEGEASVIIHSPYFHKQAEASENNATVYATIYVDKIAFPGDYIIDVDTFIYTIDLIKETIPPGDYKLK